MLLSNTKVLRLISVAIFVGFSAWWLVLLNMEEPTDLNLELFSGTYGIMALYGAIIGWMIAKQWGGAGSYVGRSIQFFAYGLLAQEFGQITYSLYTLVFSIEIPYPSIGDVGYFGSIFLYIYAIYLLGKALVVKFSLKQYTGRAAAIVVPVILLGFSYVIFLRDYVVDWSEWLVVVLDFGYPLGQAFYLSLAVLIYLLSRKYLGGVMKPVVLAIILALGVQYIADYTFLQQNYDGTWTTAGVNDYTYLFAYFVMSQALISFLDVRQKIGQGVKAKS